MVIKSYKKTLPTRVIKKKEYGNDGKVTSEEWETVCAWGEDTDRQMFAQWGHALAFLVLTGITAIIVFA
jgi:hypothetical protein